MQPGFLNATHFQARKRSLGIRYVKNDSCFRDNHYLTQRPKENVQTDKQRSTKHTYKN
jgi:hypothetical protein